MAGNWQHGVLKALGVRDHWAAVTDVIDVTPWCRRVVLSAPEFLETAQTYPTAWVRIWVPSTRDRLVQRGYTVVDPDRQTGTFSLDFIMHEPDGPATAWARSAKAGTAVMFSYTPQRYRLDETADTILLVGDATALPAINSILATLPSTAHTTALIETGHDIDRLPLANPEAIRPVSGATVGAGAIAALTELNTPNPATTYLWAAGERRLVKALRDYARTALELPRERHHLQNYWI